MRGAVTVRAGQYTLSDQVRLSIRASDAGTVISFEDHQFRRRHTAAVDEHGALVWPPGQQAMTSPIDSTAKDIASREPAVKTPAQPPVTPARKKITRGRATPARLCFKIQFDGRTPVAEAYAAGGYGNPNGVHVLCVTEARFNLHSIMLTEGERVRVGHAVPPADALAESDWTRFLKLPEYRQFRLKRW
jgi:hypothetical protein